MEYIKLEELKKHLNIDEWFTDDDNYIMSLYKVAENLVEKDIDQPLSDLEVEGQIPDALKHAMLLLVGDFYANRESVAFTSVNELPQSYKYIVRMYRNFENCNI